jgi:hypothetical protein
MPECSRYVFTLSCTTFIYLTVDWRTASIDQTHQLCCVCHRDDLTLPVDITSLDIAHARIEEAIEELQARQILIRRRRNDALPICGLPPELLGDILTLAATSNRTRELTKERSLYCADWLPDFCDPSLAIRISHVSAFFREVALDTSSLWAAPWPLQNAAHEELFTRSRQAPLDIVWQLDRIFGTVLKLRMEALQGQMARIKHLCIEVTRFGGDKSLLAQPTPRLETLLLSADDLTDEILMPTCAPRLRTLVMGPQIVSPSSSILANLTRLGVDGTGPSCTPQFVLRILDTIGMALNLQELRVRLLDRLDEDWDSSSTTRMQRELLKLPALRKVSLLGDFVCLLFLFQHISPTSGLNFALTSTMSLSGMIEDVQLDSLFGFLKPYTTVDGNAPVKIDFVEGWLTNVVWIRLWGGSSTCSLTSLGLAGSKSHLSLYLRTQDFMAAVRWNVLREVHFMICTKWMLDELLGLFGAFEHIRTLTLVYKESSTLVALIQDVLWPLNPDIMRFPGLKKIVVTNILVNEDDLLEEEEETSIEMLLRVLALRSEKGARISSLRFRNCRLDRDQEWGSEPEESQELQIATILSRLRAVVDEVQWIYEDNVEQDWDS